MKSALAIRQFAWAIVLFFDAVIPAYPLGDELGDPPP
jgi:hypothetical protein